jgi:hypothetical protein
MKYLITLFVLIGCSYSAPFEVVSSCMAGCKSLGAPGVSVRVEEFYVECNCDGKVSYTVKITGRN